MTSPRGNLSKHRSANPLQRYLIGRFFEKVRAFALEVPPGTWCEAGCGEGFALRDFFDNGILKNHPVHGFDFDEGALRFAADLVPEVKFQKGSVYEFPFQNQQLQCVMMLEVLEHLKDPEKALREAARVGHYLLLSVPHEPWFRTANFLRGKNWSRWGNDIEHIQWWGPKSFRKLLDPYGEIIRFGTSFPWLIALVKVKPTA